MNGLHNILRITNSQSSSSQTYKSVSMHDTSTRNKYWRNKNLVYTHAYTYHGGSYNLTSILNNNWMHGFLYILRFTNSQSTSSSQTYKNVSMHDSSTQNKYWKYKILFYTHAYTYHGGYCNLTSILNNNWMNGFLYILRITNSQSSSSQTYKSVSLHDTSTRNKYWRNKNLVYAHAYTYHGGSYNLTSSLNNNWTNGLLYILRFTNSPLVV